MKHKSMRKIGFIYPPCRKLYHADTGLTSCMYLQPVAETRRSAGHSQKRFHYL